MFTRVMGVVVVGLAFGLCGCKAESRAVTEVVGLVNEKPELPPADAQPVTVSISAALQPLQQDHSVDLEFHLRGGGLRADTQVATAKLILTRDELRKDVQVTLKQGYAYRYKIEAKTVLLLQGQAVLGSGSHTGTLTFTHPEERLRVAADTAGSRPQPDGAGGFTLKYKPFVEPVPAGGRTLDSFSALAPPAPGTARLVLRTPVALNKTAVSWVELDGERVAEWPTEELEVTIPTTPGDHRVAVRSIYERRSYKKEFVVSLPDGGETRQTVPGLDPDPTGKKGR